MPIGWWLVIAAVAGIVEAATAGVVSMWFCAGALCAFAAGFLGAPLWAQLVTFLVASVGLLACLRPLVSDRMPHGAGSEPSPVGSRCKVISSEAGGGTGRVETPDGMDWAARSEDGRPLETGSEHVVVSQESAVLVVGDPCRAGGVPVAERPSGNGAAGTRVPLTGRKNQ